MAKRVDILKANTEQAIKTKSFKKVMEAKFVEKDYRRILEVAFDPDQFQEIWQKCPPLAKLQFIQNNMKYVFEDKSPLDAGNSDKLDVIDKILSLPPKKK